VLCTILGRHVGSPTLLPSGAHGQPAHSPHVTTFTLMHPFCAVLLQNKGLGTSIDGLRGRVNVRVCVRVRACVPRRRPCAHARGGLVAAILSISHRQALVHSGAQVCVDYAPQPCARSDLGSGMCVSGMSPFAQAYLKICSRPFTSGVSTVIMRSKRPGRKSALSKMSGRFVPASTCSSSSAGRPRGVCTHVRVCASQHSSSSSSSSRSRGVHGRVHLCVPVCAGQHLQQQQQQQVQIQRHAHRRARVLASLCRPLQPGLCSPTESWVEAGYEQEVCTSRT